MIEISQKSRSRAKVGPCLIIFPVECYIYLLDWILIFMWTEFKICYYLNRYYICGGIQIRILCYMGLILKKRKSEIFKFN